MFINIDRRQLDKMVDILPKDDSGACKKVNFLHDLLEPMREILVEQGIYHINVVLLITCIETILEEHNLKELFQESIEETIKKLK